MVKLADWIKKNYKEVDRLTKGGLLSPTLKRDFTLYKQFEANGHIRSSMQRIENTAEEMKVKTHTVRRAVKKMNGNI